jgi:hypothetical protein
MRNHHVKWRWWQRSYDDDDDGERVREKRERVSQMEGLCLHNYINNKSVQFHFIAYSGAQM